MRELKRFTGSLKAGPDGSTFEGYAACAGNIDRQGDIIAPGALSRASQAYLQGGGILLWQHDSNEPIGRVTSAAEDAQGLMISASIVDTDTGMKARKLLAAQVVTAMSIGYSCRSSVHLDGEQSLAAYLASIGKSARGVACPKWGVRVIQELELCEISLVSVPANPAAQVTRVKEDRMRVSDIQEAVRTLRRWTAEGKAGRVLSQANRDRLGSLQQALRAAADDLDGLLVDTDDTPEPIEQEEPEEMRLRYLMAKRRALSLSFPHHSLKG